MLLRETLVAVLATPAVARPPPSEVPRVVQAARGQPAEVLRHRSRLPRRQHAQSHAGLGAAPLFAAEAHQWECDFVTPEAAIQVCAELTPQNRIRESRGLLAAAHLPGA